jgi:formylglycine-generating enzyme required for sulfatase activity
MRFMAVPGVDGLLSVFPTRVSDYQRYAEAVGAEWPAPEFTQGPGHSAVLVSWDDACCFCSWLTAREVEAGRLGRGQRFRLPTDAEWSQAIGLENEEGPTPERKWLNAQSLGVPESNELKAPEGGQFGYGTYGTVSVEAIPPNRFGLCGLSGNVWEWCADLFAAGNSLRVLRGGSWRTIRPECLRAACRLGRPTEYRADDVGFRVLLESSSRTATPTSTV